MAYYEDKLVPGLDQLVSAAANDKLPISDADNETILQYIACSNLKTYMTGGFTASRALETDGSGSIISSTITSTELGYLDGVASNIGSHMTSKDGVYHLPAQTAHASEFLTTNGTVANWTNLTGLIGSTDIQDFVISVSKLFTKIPILENDTWTDHSDPTTLYVAWSEQNIGYNGEYYVVASGNSDKDYIYWVVHNDGGDGTVANPYVTNYVSSDTAPTQTDTTFIICMNNAGVHNVAWNSIANQVIGTAYIKNGAIINAHITDATIEHAKIASVNAATITVGVLGDAYINSAATWNAKAKVFRQITEPASGMVTGDIWIDTDDGDKPYTYTGSVWNPEYTHINGGYITTGTITAITHQTALSGQRVVISAGDNTIRLHTTTADNVVIIDDGLYGLIPGIQVGESTHGGIFKATNGSASTFVTHDSVYLYGVTGTNAFLRLLHDAVVKISLYGSSGNAAFVGNVDIGSGCDVTGNITVTGIVDGVDISAHVHNTTDGSAKITHSNILSPGANDHHAQSHTLTSHSDVDTTGISDGAVLEYDTAMGWIAGSTYTPGSHVGSGGAAHADVTTSVDGFMIASDKTKLNGIESGADVTANHFPKSHDNTYHLANFATTTNVATSISSHAGLPDVHHVHHSGVSGWLGGQDIRFANGLAVEFGT